MKKIIILLFCGTVLLSAETADTTRSDTGRTSVPLSGVKYYDIVDRKDAEGENGRLSADLRPEHPFALRQPADRWFSHDKWMHLSASYFLTLQSAYAFNKMLLSEAETAHNISVGITLSLSLGKEFYDVFANDGIFSWKDLFYDILGTSLGYLTVSALQQQESL